MAPTGASSFAEALRWSSEIYQSLKQVLKTKGHSTNVGDEGGFAPALKSNAEAIEVILEQSAKPATPRESRCISVSIPLRRSCSTMASIICAKKAAVHKRHADGRFLRRVVAAKYPIISIEDGVAEDDWDTWKALTSRLGSKIQLVGDDLFVTNVERLEKGIHEGAGNSILIKLNQIGSISETMAAIETAHRAGWTAVVSHRSGETEDSTIADLVVATNAGQIKTGAQPAASVAKYNQLMRNRRGLGEGAGYAGLTAFRRVGKM